MMRPSQFGFIEKKCKMIEDLHNNFPCVVICEVGAGEGGKASINRTKKS